MSKEQIYNHNEIQHQSIMNTLIEKEEMNLFIILKPKLVQDGNQWCVLYGEDLQSGIAGFGDTPRKAVWDWNRAWDKSLVVIT